MAETTTRLKTEVSASCLSCFKPDTKHLKSLLKTYINGERYSDIYKFCTGINIEEKLPGHPPWICDICEEKLLDFYHFKSNCITSDNIIDYFLKNRPELGIKPDENMDEGTINDSDTDDEINDIKPTICELCKEVLPTTLKEYNEHIATHDPGNSEPFKCKTCPAKFVNSNLLRIHVKSHKKEKDRYKSEYCNTWFPNSSLMIKHENNYHVDERIFKCEISKESFLTHTKLMAHFEKYHLPDEPYICISPYKHVPKNFKKCPNTVDHSCDICKRKFPTRANLKLHMRTIHPAEAPLPYVEEPCESYQCEFCGKCFTKKDSYDIHKMFHPEQLEDGETLSKTTITGKIHCSKCDINIYQLALYEAHMERFHKNDYTCHVCKKFFFDRKGLPEHRRKHFKLDNHVCKICEKRFLKSINLKKHIKSYHPGAANAKRKPVYFKRTTIIQMFRQN